MGQTTPKNLPLEKKGLKASEPSPQGNDAEMGFALRSVYQKTVEESVPADLLDLLGKLD